MFATTNATRHSATAVILTDPDGRPMVVAVAKATFALGSRSRLEPAPEPAPLELVDQYAGEPGRSSLRAGSDLALTKPRADVIVRGSAVAPGARAVPTMNVAVRVGSVAAELCVTGDRVWKKALFGVSPGSPKPFQDMPLVWERAYGGESPAKDGDGVVRDARNPVGRGFWLTDKLAVDEPLPNLEWPDARLEKLADRPLPAGFGFVAPDWASRAAFAGTYDAAWEKERSPLLPADFDARFFNAAPGRLQSSAYFVGGEPVRLTGFHVDGEHSFELPRDEITVDLLTPGDRLESHAARLDTVILDTSAAQVQLVWRVCVPAPYPITRLQHVRIRSARFPAEVAGTAVAAGAKS